MIIRGTPVPPWQQLAAILRGQIESGELRPGAQLPSALTLSADYEVSVPTVNKAVAALRGEGLITGVPGYGRFVAEDAVKRIRASRRRP